MNASVASNEIASSSHLLQEIASGYEDVDRGIPAFIRETNWTVLTKRLTAHTHFRLARHGSLANRYLNRAEDYVQEAVIRLMDGTRQLADGSEKHLFWFLCGVIDSLVSHDAEKARRRGIQLLITTEDNNLPDEVEEEHLSSSEDFERRIILRNELAHFMASLEPDLEQYVRLRAAGKYETAEEYAMALNTTVSDIRNMDRRLKRRRRQW
ncbi:MAG: hypothetical protein QOE68_3389 [Thermoanaerobaculia bacterium]|nr:hypothetical protein [Thermoanaerobaculia bacterium]